MQFVSVAHIKSLWSPQYVSQIETCRVMQGVLPLWEGHRQRITQTLDAYALPKLDFNELETAMQHIVANTPSAKLRILLLWSATTLYIAMEMQPFEEQDLLFTIQHTVIHNTPELNTRSVPAKDFAAMNDIAKLRAAVELPPNEELLLLHHDGKIIESSISNVFFVKGNTIITPKQTDLWVNGIMRQYIMTLPLNNTYNIIEQDIFVHQLKQFDAAFMTNAVRGVMPIAQILGEEMNVQCSQAFKHLIHAQIFIK